LLLVPQSFSRLVLYDNVELLTCLKK